ncbi:MAG: hypothetical protein ACK56F_17255, partial [bacterium]
MAEDFREEILGEIVGPAVVAAPCPDEGAHGFVAGGAEFGECIPCFRRLPAGALHEGPAGGGEGLRIVRLHAATRRRIMSP